LREVSDVGAVDAFNTALDRPSRPICASCASWQGPQDAVPAVQDQRRSLGA
jgi:hypothetical protein